ncbi:YihA family ribosome biogenesis GTP-binding protein [Candidatus Gracilibacteria bacterium]|nr:YihA family ribosome biogenesis GTP-binding protein [Candidatus Gracilibacteria bacterium]
MEIRSAEFVKGVVGPDDVLNDGKPQIAIIGRSNVGKSSLINSLTRKENLARTSPLPGRTQELNLFLINKSFYLVDLPGYGFAKTSHESREKIHNLVNWYFFDSEHKQKKVVLIIDANIGLTDSDLEMLCALEEHGKDIIFVANKIDKMKSSECQRKLNEIRKSVGARKVIPYSSKKKIGIAELAKEFQL